MAPQKQTPDRLPAATTRAAPPRSKGCLKLFFGYAPGVGTTYAMLKAAHAEKQRGIDVVAGYVEPHARAQTSALLSQLEQLPCLRIPHHGTFLREFDLDAALSRKPQLILVDQLAQINPDGCRHTKRYQDVEELLNAGIDVYSTVNVQHIESLNDIVASILGVAVGERIPDSVFDNADQVKLIDAEPQELLERLRGGGQQVGPWAKSSFTAENLTALRELALRRCADRMNLLTESARMQVSGDYRTDEHILVCLSSAPSNAKLIRTAARMAAAFKGMFTALFVETPNLSAMSEENKQRLQANMRLAQQLGAQIETVFGDDVPLQIAEFARLSGVSKVVIGRSTATRRGLFAKPTLTERLIASAPNLDVHIIPDSEGGAAYRERKAKGTERAGSPGDAAKTIGVLILATLVGWIFYQLGFTEANIITVYILGVLIISIFTANRAYSLAASAVSVLIFNFFFTTPRFTFRAYDSGYPVTFAVMFAAAFIMGSLTSKLKEHAKKSAQAAHRTKILFDTNQLLQQAKDSEAILSATAEQLVKLLGKSIAAYPVESGELGKPRMFFAGRDSRDNGCMTENERAVAVWVSRNNKHAGATTDTLSGAKCLYLAIRVNQSVYGVVGIELGGQPLDTFENSVVLSMLGECALALENEKNAREKEQAAVAAENEQLRANLLRAISHDLRTPLTSISGNASNLLSNGDSFDQETKNQIYGDIYDDSMWLINLVENLLSVSRIEEGRMNLHLTSELMDEVIAEALCHVNRQSVQHTMITKSAEDFILAKMDAKLMVQVVINIVDNAIKYTPAGSTITIFTEKKDEQVCVSIADDGPGIPDDAKGRVFDMFYSGNNRIADSRRSLGLGLSLCRSILQAHGGTISVSDNVPQGAVFTFTLPIGEVTLHE